jgi:glycine/D-amino acid oxidase-like deaminating enzyme
MSAKILLVGQGLAGSVLALQAEEAGFDVHIADDDRPIRASQWAGGVVNPVSFKRLTLSWKIDELLPVMHQFLTAVETKFQLKFYTPLTFHRVFASIEEQNQWDVISEGPKGKYYSSKRIESLNAAVDAPYGIGEVLHSGWLNVPHFLSVVRSYFKSIQKFHQQTIAEKDLLRTDKTWLWNEIEFDFVVVCSGISLNEWPSLSPISVIPNKGETVTLNLPEAHWNEMIHFGNFLLPLEMNNYKLGATFDWSPTNEFPTETAKEELLKAFQSHINTPFQVVQHSAGLRPTTKDRRPILGCVEENGIHFFGGLGAKGVLLAPYFSNMLITNLLHGTPLHQEVNAKRYLKS